MESTHHEFHTFCKNLEKEINKKIHEHTNCLTYTQTFGKLMELHLDQVLFHRKLVSEWLKSIDAPNKDELAAIAVRKVEYVEKLDELEESSYRINQRQKENSSQLNLFKKTLQDLLVDLEKEVKELRVNKINSLEKDLEDLIQLFDS